MTSVPEITRMIARIEDWKGQGPVLGRAEAARQAVGSARSVEASKKRESEGVRARPAI